jgi:glycogen debranching enzyme
MSYHNGSVWPHDNAMIATGLARYGDGQATARIFQGMFDAATYMDLRRLPELFSGFPRFRGRGPTLYPVACAPQAWSSAVFFALLQASLGIEQDPFANVSISQSEAAGVSRQRRSSRTQGGHRDCRSFSAPSTRRQGLL